MTAAFPDGVALAIPTYNREAYLQQLLQSVPRDVPCYVSDNKGCLKSSPLQQLQGVAISSLDTLIPVYENWIRAASLVKKEAYFAITSDDDMYMPGGFDVIRRVIHEDCPGYDIYIFGHDFIDEFNVRTPGYKPSTLERHDGPEGFLNFYTGVHARTPSVFFSKSFFEEIGGFDKVFQLTAGDSELIQRALLKGRSVFVPEVVSCYRVWRESSTVQSQASDEWMKEVRIWAGKTAAFAAAALGPAGKEFDAGNFKAGIVAENLFAGVNSLLLRKQHAEARRFLAEHGAGIFTAADWRLRLRLLRFWLRALLKP